MSTLSTGQLATRVGVNVETIRYYERRGLLPKPTVRASGYRCHSEADVARFSLIQTAKSLGFTLTEIGELIEIRAAQGHPCESLRFVAENKIKELSVRITELQSARDRLEQLIETCGNSGQCRQQLVQASEAVHEKDEF